MKSKGFTLVELSIVLIVIGVIAGAVIASTGLIKASKLKTLVAQGQEYHQAYDIFRERFSYMPGDFPDGAQYWGNDCEGATIGDDLCSGGGDYELQHGLLAAGNTFQTFGSSEPIVLWKHLEKAELLSGNYTGVSAADADCGGSPYQCVNVGENVPMAKYGDGVGFYIITSTGGAETAIFTGKANHPSWNSQAFLLPKDSYSLDLKIDDGVADTGYFRGSGVTGASLSGGTCHTSGTYDLDGSTESCGVVLILEGL